MLVIAGLTLDPALKNKEFPELVYVVKLACILYQLPCTILAGKKNVSPALVLELKVITLLDIEKAGLFKGELSKLLKLSSDV